MPSVCLKRRCALVIRDAARLRAAIWDISTFFMIGVTSVTPFLFNRRQ